MLEYKDILFQGLISSHLEMWGELFLEKYKKFLFFGLCKLPPEVQEFFFLEKIQKFFKLGDRKFHFPECKKFFQGIFLKRKF